MRSVLKAVLIAITLAALPFASQAGTWEGVAIGAGSGMVIAGPPGAVVGGVIGGVVGGPDVGRRYRHCWINDKAIADAVGINERTVIRRNSRGYRNV